MLQPFARGGVGDRVAELERLANTDELTGLANRRRWTAFVRGEIESGQPGNVLLCDVDCFKQINDAHGHATGDIVLTEVARILARHGTAGRLGGDEFALWVPGHAGGRVAAERIVSEVASAFPVEEQLGVGVSIGVAPAGVPLSDALESADRALYAAKAGGRRRACFSEHRAP